MTPVRVQPARSEAPSEGQGGSLLRGAALVLAAAGCLGACSHGGINPRRLHYVDGTLVASRPVAPPAYAAYLRARLALEANPPRLDEAAAAIDEALHFDRTDPHLWTTKALVEHRRGNDPAALDHLSTALDLQPDYPPATELAARIRSGETTPRTARRGADGSPAPQ